MEPHEKPRRAGRLATAALVVVALLLLSVVAWLGLPSVTVEVDGCAVRFAGGLCEVDDTPTEHFGAGVLRIRVDAEDEEEVLLLHGWHRIDARRIQDDARASTTGRLLELTAPPGRGTLTILARDGLLLRRASLELSDRREPSWLRDARFAWLDNRSNDAEKILRAHLADDVPIAQRAQATGLLARVLIDYDDHREEAKTLLRQALVEDRQAKLVTSEAEDVLALARLLGHFEDRLQEAEQLHQQTAAVFDRAPSLMSNRYYQLAEYRERRGDLPAALRLADHAREWAALFHQRYTEIDAELLRVRLLWELGFLDDALRLVDQIDNTGLPPCREAWAIEPRGEARMMILEERGAATPIPAERDPRPFLKRANALFQACGEQHEVRNNLVLRAHAALVMNTPEEADQYLAAIRGPSPPDPTLELELLDLDGRVALARGRWRDADRIYRDLLGRALQGSAAASLSDAVWRAWVGIAEVAEAQHAVAAAIDAYRNAESALDATSIALPPLPGPGRPPARHERATGRLIELLVEQHREAEAFQTMRKASRRRLLAFANLAASVGLDDAQRDSRRRLVETYLARRAELDRVEVARDEGQADAPELRRRGTELRSELAEIVRRVIALGGWRAPDEDPRPPDAGEVLVGCHPVRAGLLCMAAMSDELLLVPPIEGFTRNAPASEVQRWFKSLMPLLRRAHRLTGLYSETVMAIDFAPVLLDDRPLGERLDLTVSLDLPRAKMPVRPAGSGGRATAKKALVVLGPDLETGLDQARQSVATLLEHGWQASLWTEAQTGSMPNPSPLVAAPADHDGDGASLRRIAAAQTLLAYLGHQENLRDAEPGRAIRLAHVELTPADIMLSATVPEILVLAACETGVSEEERAGFEAFGLAPAYLLKGSEWAVASSQVVETSAAAELLLQLSACADLAGSPSRCLHQARTAATVALARGHGANDESRGRLMQSIGAFRVVTR